MDFISYSDIICVCIYIRALVPYFLVTPKLHWKCTGNALELYGIVEILCRC